MIQSNGHPRDVAVELFDGAFDHALAVRNAWLPIVVWDDVRLKMLSSRRLTPLERFVIECLLELGDCGADDLLEVAGITVEMADWLLASLVQRGMARRTGTNGTRATADLRACDDALKANVIRLEREETRTVLWFPDTDEYVVLNQSRAILRELGKLESLAMRPCPERWRREERRKLLQGAIDARRVYGEEAAAISGVIDSVRIENETFPAYLCSSVVPETSDGEWKLTLIGRRKQRGKPKATAASEREEDRTEVELRVPVLRRQVEDWRQQLRIAHEQIRARLAECGLSLLTLKEVGGCANIDYQTAKVLGDGKLLSERMNLSVQIDREIEFSLPFALSPADSPARQMFALDHAVRELLAATNPTAALENVCVGGALSPDRLVNRLWQLRLFATIYALREAKDFSE